MEERTRRIGIGIGVILVLVGFFQLVWPLFFPSLVKLNRYPTAEYFRVMWLLSPDGLSVITVLLGCILIAWAAYIAR